MQIIVWNDYICPWAYAARPLTAWLVERGAADGVTVVQRSFELHPEIPPEGAPLRPGGRLDRVFDHIAEECQATGLAFTKPTRSPNTHRLLQIAEIVNDRFPDHFAAVDEGLARAHWVEGRAIDDAAVIDEVLVAAGAPVEEVRDLEAQGHGARLLDESHALAREVGATGTPAWLVNGMVITGLHPREQFERWLNRVIERAATHPAEDG